MGLMLKFCVAGQWVDQRERSIDVVNPATETLLGKLPVASINDLVRAVKSAEIGFLDWARRGAKERSKTPAEMARLIRDRKALLAHDLTQEQGKPIAEARAEAEDAADWFEWYDEEGKRSYGRIVPSIDPTKSLSVIKEPTGVVAVFSPWNFPISEPAAHMAAALAAGCSVIVKPSEETPAAEPVRNVAFTGSIAVGKHLAGMAGSHMKRFTMELGGNAPMIVCGDVDPAHAARLLAAKKFRNAGQVCTAPNRIFVNKRIYDTFLSELSKIALQVRVGNGLDEGTQMGPLINAKRVSTMSAVVDDATKRGAQIRAGGLNPNSKGFFWPPTVLADVDDGALAMTEEIFGPIAAVSRFDTIDEVMSRANATNAGLASYVFTNSSKDAACKSRGIKTGMVGVNTATVAFPEVPFGGVKDSGLGRIGGSEGIEAYLNTKLISTSLEGI
jgi:succinate-semialdehyde dehydrogenase / glutarate-semialdehyde dehydrogenase